MSKVIRSVKNVTKGYSGTQIKVRNATSNDPWGPTGTEMQDIARMTFDSQTDFFEIMDMIDKRLNDKGKNWRHVLKAIKVLDYCLHDGSEHVVVWAKDNVYIIKTLREFQYIDEDGRDQGQNIRVAARELTSLLQDEERLRRERKDRNSWRNRVNGIEDYHGGSPTLANPHERRRRHSNPSPRRPMNDEEDLEYRLALEASKNQAEEDRAKRASLQGAGENDADLAKAIKLSKEEEERRRREIEQSNADALFDDTPTPQPQPQPQPTGQQYQQLGQVDFWGNPVDQQNTGLLNNFYSQPTGQFPQQYPQQTGWDMQQQMLQQQQQQQQPQQTGFLPQPTGFNPYGQQQTSPQAANFLAPGDNNPYANGLQQQAQPLEPLPTGSNNPFAPKMPTSPYASQTSPARNGAPSLQSLSEQKQQNDFFATFQAQSANSRFSPQPNQQSFQSQTLSPSASTPSFRPGTSPGPPPSQDPHKARLENLFADGANGQDTFGNVGDLRIPAQHTAPGTFVNSAGKNRDMVTGASQNNPFFQQQQFTGMPPQQQHQGGGLAPGVQRGLAPALTGPAGANGFGRQGGGGNPWGQQQQGGSGGGNLIDL